MLLTRIIEKNQLGFLFRTADRNNAIFLLIYVRSKGLRFF